ncbi:putative ribokinase [Sorochytrium milnesiophthora]
MLYVVGSINIDDVYRVHRIVRPGQTASSLSKTRHAGGKGANQSVAASKVLQQRVYHVGVVGSDGEWVRDLMAASGVNPEHIIVDKEGSTGRAIIQVALGGENAILLDAGTNSLLDVQHLPTMPDNSVVLFQNEVRHSAELMRAVRQSTPNAMIVFNPAPCTADIVQEYDLNCVDVLVVNEEEAATLCNMSPDALTASAAQETAFGDIHRQLYALSKRLQLVVVTLGAKGVRLMWRPTTSNDSMHIDAMPIYPVDTTGAGDTFLGYFAAIIARDGVNLQAADRSAVVRAVTHGVVAAGIACQTDGAMASIPSLATVLDMGKQRRLL